MTVVRAIHLAMITPVTPGFRAIAFNLGAGSTFNWCPLGHTVCLPCGESTRHRRSIAVSQVRAQGPEIAW